MDVTADMVRAWRYFGICAKVEILLKNRCQAVLLLVAAHMDGKIFAGFIVLMLRTYLLQKIKGNHKTKNMTIEKALLELKKIKVVQMEG